MHGMFGAMHQVAWRSTSYVLKPSNHGTCGLGSPRDTEGLRHDRGSQLVIPAVDPAP